MWGTLGFHTYDEGYTRFIPTHVGNTWNRSLRNSQCPVHPHACGEHSFTLPLIPACNGSSPRMWGTQSGQGRDMHKDRFIPTHVGNTP